MVSRTPLSPPHVGHRSAKPDYKAPDCSEIRLLVGEHQGATRAGLCEVSIGPGDVSKPVRHRTVEEIWYLIEGEGTVWRCQPGVEPTSVPGVAVRPGDALSIPTHWAFQFQASGDRPLRFLCYTCPPWPGPEEAEPVEVGGLGPPTACMD
jgi:mannose-6-phosphate isomerase-like protein (cupin superfamily)